MLKKILKSLHKKGFPLGKRVRSLSEANQGSHPHSPSRFPRPYLIGSALLIILLLGPAAYFLTKNAKSVDAAWFNESWAYRQAIRVTNNTTAETNVYINFTGADALDTADATKFQTDCGDLRFTKENGELLPFFPVSGCGTGTTVVHVNFNTLSAGSQTIYLYYGNSNADNGFASADFSTEASNYTLGSPATEEQSPGPVAYWKFDEGYGTTANDSTSNANNGTLGVGTSAPEWQSEDMCLSGKCLLFDGSNDYVDQNNVILSTSDGTQPYSASAWIKTSTDGGIVTQYVGGDGNRFGLRVMSSKLVYWKGSSKATSTKDVNDNDWHHVSFTKDSSGNIKLYIDGILDGTGTDTAFFTNTNTVVGNFGSISAISPFNGFIDDVKIYPYARTAAQIKTDFASRGSFKGTSATIGGQDPATSLSNGLVGYWKMDESSWDGTANEVIDSSGNANHGIGVGATAPPTTGAGKFGNGGIFDGTEDYLSVSSNDTLRFIGSNFSLSSWIYLESSDSGGLVYKGGGTVRTGYGMYQTSSNIRFIYSDTTETYDQEISVPATIGSWFHATLTVDKQTNLMSVYINGVPQETMDITGIDEDVSATNALEFGKTGSWYSNGKVDETRIYNRALSPVEIRALYNFAPGPIVYFPLDEGTNTTTYDKASGSTGTLTNSPLWISGKYGKGLQFSSTDNNYVTFNPLQTLDSAASNLTISVWFKELTGGTYLTSRSGGNVYLLRSSDNITFRANPGVSNSCTSTSNPNADGQWHYATLTWNGTTLKGYIDSKLECTDNTGSGGLTLGTTTWEIGHRPAVSGISGKLDDFKIYNYARTPGQIVQDMNASHPIGGSPIASQLAYYKFDEGYGTVANNSGFGGTAINGSLGVGTSAPSWSNAGKFGKALSFDAGDFVTVPNDNSIKTSNVTFSTWINVTGDGTNGYNGIVEKIGGTTVTNTNRLLVVNASNLLLMQFTGLTQFNSTNVVSRDTWHHITYTYDGHNQKIYIDGILDNTQADEGGAIDTGTNDLYIGRGSINSNTYFFNGLIDEVKIYNTALTQEEILIDYNHGAAMVMGATSTAADGTTADNSSDRSYCVPGDTSTCSPPVAEWKMDENTGTTSTYDSSGNGFTGTLTSITESSWVPGKYGSALNLDGSSDYVSVTDATDSSLDVTDSLTMSVWVKTTSGDNEGLIYKGDFSGTQGTYQIHLKSSTTVPVIRLNQSASEGSGQLTGNTTVNDGNWHHIAATYDKTNIKLYIDGGLDNSNSYSTSLSTNNNPLHIGGYYSSSYTLNGSIDDVRIYNYARTQAQIAWDYNRGAPVGHWKLDECQGTTAYDSSGNTNNGTITIGATGTNTTAGTCSSGTGSEAWNNGTTGKRNASLSFDGTDDYVTLTSEPNYSQGGTISTWIKTTDTTARIIALDSTLLGIGNSTAMYLCADGSGCSVSVGTDNVPDDGNWHHVLMTWDNTNLSYYLDGKFVTSVADSGAVSSGRGSYLGVGDSGATLQDYFNGQIDDIKIYNYALTAQQIKVDYTMGALLFN